MPIIRKIVKPDARFGRLVVVECAGRSKNRQKLWRCVCDCGREKIICAHSLRHGVTTSCGCYRTEVITTHGETANYIHRLWTGIKQRCYDSNQKNYRNYGGRGVKMHEPWVNDYPAFAAYIRENLGERPTTKHSMDRVDNEKDYEPGNLRWATRSEQNSNTRSSRLITHEGRTQTLKQWSIETGIHHNTIRGRLSNNWTVRAALSSSFVEYESKELNNE